MMTANALISFIKLTLLHLDPMTESRVKVSC